MTDSIAPEYARFVAAERRTGRLPAPPAPLAEGEPTKPVFVNVDAARQLIAVAAKRSSGLFRPTKRSEVVWTSGESELAVSMTEIEVRTDHGLIHVAIPVRCDQTGPQMIEVLFAVGSADQPAGMYASTTRLPSGPPAIVNTWGEALVAYAWQCVLGMIAGVAGAVGKDHRGNVLVPAEMVASPDGLQILPMARHRFSGSTGLLK